MENAKPEQKVEQTAPNTGNQIALIDKTVADQVLTRVHELENGGRVILPKN